MWIKCRNLKKKITSRLYADRVCHLVQAYSSTYTTVCKHTSVSALLHRRLSYDAPVVQPSAIELFRSPLPDCGTLCRWTSRRRRHWLSFKKRLKTHLFSHSFPESPVVSAQWLSHFRHYNRSLYLLTYLLNSCIKFWHWWRHRCTAA